MMPSADRRQEERLARRRRMFEPSPGPTEPATSPSPTAEQWAAMVDRWWERDRRARIAAGACPLCAERRCPRVGGPDAACVP